MVHMDAKAGMPHFFPALITVGVVAVILFAARAIAIHVEQRTISATAPEAFSLKNQGLAFQRAAAHASDVLPLYGSSELLGQIPERGGNFFRAAPTGFQLSPVGKAGATSMIMLQKIGALGSDLRGKKLAISLSPIWFVVPATSPYWYEGNFSLLAASKLAFGDVLDFELKRTIAARMVQFPSTLEKDPLLEFALKGRGRLRLPLNRPGPPRLRRLRRRGRRGGPRVGQRLGRRLRLGHRPEVHPRPR